MTDKNDSAPAGGADPWTTASVVAVLALTGFQAWWGIRMRGELDDLRATAARLEAAAAKPAADVGKPAPAGADAQAMQLIAERLEALQGDFAVLADDVNRLSQKFDGLAAALEQRGTISSETPQPADLDWTQPELFEAARKAADTVGVTLTKDEVRVPAKVCLREGPLEYFAVLKGGKEHETLLSILGNTALDQRRPKDLGVKLNNAIQALGFKRGKPIKFTPAGTRPAQGQTVHLYIEWTTGGKTEIVRAEDVVWNRLEDRPMSRDAWVYVGSSFVPGDDPGTVDFAADLTAECVATYSAPNTMIDNIEPGAQDDTVFLAATPRIPEDVNLVTLVIRREPLATVKEFPAIPGRGK